MPSIATPESVDEVTSDVRELITAYAKLQSIATNDRTTLKSLALQAKTAAQWTLFTYRDAERSRDIRYLQSFASRRPASLRQNDVRAIALARQRIKEDLDCVQQTLKVALANRDLTAKRLRQTSIVQQRQLKAIETGMRSLNEQYQASCTKRADRQRRIQHRLCSVDRLGRDGQANRKEVANFVAKAKAEVLEWDLEAETFQERHGKLRQQFDAPGVVKDDRPGPDAQRMRLNSELDKLGSDIFIKLAGLESLLQALDQATALLKHGGVQLSEQPKERKALGCVQYSEQSKERKARVEVTVEELAVSLEKREPRPEVTVQELPSPEMETLLDRKKCRVTFKLEAQSRLVQQSC